jgi:hypothetical protein
MSDNKEIKFVNNGKGQATRYKVLEWEGLKSIILKKYETKTLETVRKEMEEEYQFVATTRQLVHHIGTVWGVTKYKKGQPSRSRSTKRKNASNAPSDDGPGTERENPKPTPMTDGPPDSPSQKRQAFKPYDHAQQNFQQSASVPFPMLAFHINDPPLPTPQVAAPRQATAVDPQRYTLRLLAGILFAYGDSVAFRLYKELCKPEFPDELLFDLIACTRAALTAQDAEQARAILQDHVDNVLSDQDEESPLATLVDLQAARTYDWGNDAVNAIGQIEQRILYITEDRGNKAYLKRILPRGHLLDIPLFDYLSYAVKRWNDATVGGNSQIIVVDEFLDQFLDQQQLSSLTCLVSCLEWCIAVLRRGPSIPDTLQSTSTYPIDAIDAIEATYQLLGTFWSALLKDTTAAFSTPWVKAAKPELGIEAAELLSTFACMIIAQPGVSFIRSNAVMQESLSRAEALSTPGRYDIPRLFLQHMRWNNDRRMFSLAVPNDPRSPTIYHRFRAFAFASLGIQMQLEDYDAPIIPLVLGPPVDGHPMHMDMGMDIQHPVAGPSGDVHMDAVSYQQGHGMATRSQSGSDGNHMWP